MPAPTVSIQEVAHLSELNAPPPATGPEDHAPEASSKAVVGPPPAVEPPAPQPVQIGTGSPPQEEKAVTLIDKAWELIPEEHHAATVEFLSTAAAAVFVRGLVSFADDFVGGVKALFGFSKVPVEPVRVGYYPQQQWPEEPAETRCECRPRPSRR